MRGFWLYYLLLLLDMSYSPYNLLTNCPNWFQMRGFWFHVLVMLSVMSLVSSRTVFYPEEEPSGPMPREISIHRYPRPNHCATRFQLYYMCYQCGRLAQAQIVYQHCCDDNPVVVDFCTQVTT